MKNLVIVLGLALASLLAVAAPETAKEAAPRGAPGGPHPAWHDEIGLTDEQRQEMHRIQQAGGTRAEIRAILTPEQQEKIRELKGAQRGNGPGIDQLKEELDLSDEQSAQMKKIREAGGSREDMHKVLTPEQQEKLKERKRRQRSAHRAPAPPQGSPPAGEAPPGWGLKEE